MTETTIDSTSKTESAAIQHGRATFARSLTQTRHGLAFKCTKSERPRVVKVPEVHRKRQDEFRRQFGSDYKEADLIFADPDGSLLKPDSVSAAVSRCSAN